MPDVTLDLGNQYIGSAYSPQVAVTETATGHEIEFTFADSEHPGQLKTEGFEVPNYASEEAEREAAEAERAAAESARVAAEEGRMNRELDRVFNENARINAEELREDAETARASAEQARAAAETARASAEGSRASAEQARASAETARASAEAGRATAESARVSAEQARATAESARAAAESARVTAEQARQADTTAAIARADDATAAANTATEGAEAATTAAQAATGEAETATDAANAAAALATAAAETVTDAYFPNLTAGAAEGITGGGPNDTAAWTYRACPGTDGPATIESIHGRTLRWNQLNSDTDNTNTTGLTVTKNGDGSRTLNGTATSNGVIYFVGDIKPVANHKYLVKGCPAGGSASTYYLSMNGQNADYGTGGIITVTNPLNPSRLLMWVANGQTFSNVTIWPQVFDLTAMFGAGNEPSTVAEFEALYPDAYYPYDAGSLLSVHLEGIETVGENLWGGDAFKADFLALASSVVESSNAYGKYIDLPASVGSGSPAVFSGTFKPNTAYTLILRIGKNNTNTGTNLRVSYTDGTTGNISRQATTSNGSAETVVFVTNASKTLASVNAMNSSGHSYLYYDECGLFEGVLAADGFKPYWTAQRAIPAGTLRSAGSVYDEQTATERITRVGEVDMGTLEWVHAASDSPFYYAPLADAATADYGQYLCECSAYTPIQSDGTIQMNKDKTVCLQAGGFKRVLVRDESYQTSDAATFKAAMSGETLTYALATPTTTPITPPLNMTYRAAAGGTERIVHTDPTAAPTLVVTYGSTADGIRDRALACIAPVENGRASANYGVGSYLIHAGQLCRVTTAIAAGEAITIGTNVTATTVMAEVIRLTQ